MNIIYALAVVVLTLVAVFKMPYPGAKPISPNPVSAAVAATPATAAKAAEAAPAVVVAPEPPRVQYVSTRQCSRTAWGNVNCTEITTVKRGS
ncbi:hypothetical protein PQJ75_05685 [Rhodoplanes sp. TEM]|uniref:Uncharacterized protein n=1 Tax=Rhodoplanes tepidamans TaxID=200616 RepID=A0ABT5J379_RHOTP|nr:MULTISPECIES: hypothetical protein [Rhodoplanes]MDC7784120.1 hypothetical protein [Rhodoplanes tepidamans]MDC7983215.1 hypothetical protein [Rhodoplanes sp. TEM]MDQ0356783.1 hypothetical protein [Rhodoplanes tepidamans]